MSAFCGFRDEVCSMHAGFPPTRLEARTTFPGLASAHQPALLMRCCTSCKAVSSTSAVWEFEGQLMSSHGINRRRFEPKHSETSIRKEGKNPRRGTDASDGQENKRETATTRTRNQGKGLARQSTHLTQPHMSTTNHQQHQQRQKLHAKRVLRQELGEASARKKDGHYEGRTRDLGVSRISISTTL